MKAPHHLTCYRNGSSKSIGSEHPQVKLKKILPSLLTHDEEEHKESNCRLSLGLLLGCELSCQTSSRGKSFLNQAFIIEATLQFNMKNVMLQIAQNKAS